MAKCSAKFIPSKPTIKHISHCIGSISGNLSCKNFISWGRVLEQKKSGLFLFIPSSEWDETPKLSIPDEKLLKESKEIERKILSAPHVDLIRISLASGYDSFMREKTLEALLKNPMKTWKILLLDPNSKGAKERAAHYFKERASDPPSFTSETDYILGIQETLSNISNIKKNTIQI